MFVWWAGNLAVAVRCTSVGVRESPFSLAAHYPLMRSKRNTVLVQNSHITIKSTRTPNSMRCIELGGLLFRALDETN